MPQRGPWPVRFHYLLGRRFCVINDTQDITRVGWDGLKKLSQAKTAFKQRISFLKNGAMPNELMNSRQMEILPKKTNQEIKRDFVFSKEPAPNPTSPHGPSPPPTLNAPRLTHGQVQHASLNALSHER